MSLKLYVSNTDFNLTKYFLKDLVCFLEYVSLKILFDLRLVFLLDSLVIGKHALFLIQSAIFFDLLFFFFVTVMSFRILTIIARSQRIRDAKNVIRKRIVASGASFVSEKKYISCIFYFFN